MSESDINPDIGNVFSSRDPGRKFDLYAKRGREQGIKRPKVIRSVYPVRIVDRPDIDSAKKSKP